MSIMSSPSAIYPGAVKTANVKVSSANTARDGSGSLTALVAAIAAASGGTGAVVSRIGILSSAAIGASTPMVARLWRVSAGAVITLEDEIALVTATTSNTVVGTRTQFNRTNIILAPGDALKVTISIAEAVDFAAEYAEY